MHAFKKRERTAKNLFEFLWTESDLFEKISANVSSFGTISEWLFSEIWQWDCCKGGLLALISSWVDWWINVLRADGAGSWTIKSVLEISIELFCWECLFNFIDCRWGGIQSESWVGRRLFIWGLNNDLVVLMIINGFRENLRPWVWPYSFRACPIG